MSFFLQPESEAAIGRHKLEIEVTDQPQFHCDCDSESKIVIITIEMEEASVGKEITFQDFDFAYDFTVSKEKTDQPTVDLKKISETGIITLEFSKPVYEIEEPEIFVDGAVLSINIMTEYDIYEPDKML